MVTLDVTWSQLVITLVQLYMGQGFHNLVRQIALLHLHMGQGFHTLVRLITLVQFYMGEVFHLEPTSAL